MVNGFRSNALFQNAPLVFRAAVAAGANALATSAPLGNDMVEVTSAGFPQLSEPVLPGPFSVQAAQPSPSVTPPPSSARAEQHTAKLRPVKHVHLRQPKSNRKSTPTSKPTLTPVRNVEPTEPKTSGHKPHSVKVKHQHKVKEPKAPKPPKQHKVKEPKAPKPPKQHKDKAPKPPKPVKDKAPKPPKPVKDKAKK